MKRDKMNSKHNFGKIDFHHRSPQNNFCFGALAAVDFQKQFCCTTILKRFKEFG